MYVLFYFDNVKGEFLWGKDEKVLQIPPARDLRIGGSR